MKSAECRKLAHAILRDSTASMRRSLAEAERLLRLAEAPEPEEIELRRRIEQLDSIDLEHHVGSAQR